jgi:hypothetical protein
MCKGIDKTKKHTNTFLDFCMPVANEIGLVGQWIKLRKGGAILKLL